MKQDIVMPNLGAVSDEATLVQWFVKEGDAVSVGQPIFELETDKSTVVVEATEPGVISRLLANEGETMVIGTPVAVLEVPRQEPAETRAGEAAPDATPDVASVPSVRRDGRVDISPRARALAQELGVDLTNVAATGSGGRVVEADVRAAAKQLPVPVPAAGTADPLAAMKGHRGIVARRMTESAHSAAAVTLTTEVDAQPLVDFLGALRAANPDVADCTSLDLLLAALAGRALREHPALNATLGSEGIVVHPDAHVGIAIDGARGLVVPVLRDPGGRSLVDLASEWRSLRARALAGTATPADLSGGTFSVTNLGHLGVDAFTPIINLGEAAILGVGRIAERPVVRNGRVRPARTVVLSLTFDHRIVDGAPAARFLREVGTLVEQPARAGMAGTLA